MKALSIKQPWLELILEGEKTIETRTWETKHRGPLLLCASKSIDHQAANEFFPNGHTFQTGMALAIADLVLCLPMQKEHQIHAMCQTYPGAWSWMLKNVRPIDPFPVKGRLGLFEVEMEEK